MIPNRHVSLLILTRYKGSLRHVLTRVKYTSCPACHKTTKDYGGKKHMYHSYGTLISDVWTDIECAPETDIRYVTRRLQTLFALSPYKKLLLIDLRQCKDQADVSSNGFKRQIAQSKKTLKPTAIRSRLINADCMTALESLRSDSIDFCFADLPYNLRKKYYRYNDALGEQEYFAWCNEWLSQLHRVLKPGRTLAVLNVPQWSAKHLMFLSSFMDFQAWIVWDALGFPCRKIMPAHYAIVCFSKGRACLLPGLSSPNGNVSEREYLLHRGQYYCTRPSCVRTRRARGVVDRADISDIWSDIHRLTHNSQRVNHPCQLPPLLMRRLFSLFTKQDEAILDCFNGAGTSTLVAQQMGRRFIGIEISRRYHNLALQRHRLISAGGDPFGKRDAIPIVKNSRVIRLMKQPYKVSKKDLQLEVKRIADELKRLPQPEDVKLHSKFPMKYFNDYFTSWSEVCAAARMTLDSR
ncbi:MAG TPA: DNA methyltransferase [Pyrinomonadaceae bacterium]